jgi:hypothetical protein
MEPIEAFSLVKHDGPYESWPARTRLVRDGVATATEIPGYEIEAQYRTDGGYLLVTSFDCPFEESNAFVLLDARLAVVARRELLVPYGSFLLHAHWPIDTSTLALHYYEELFYTLHIQPPRRFFGRRPRLTLRRCLAWQRDARMRQSAEALKAKLAQIAASMNSDGSG